MRTETAQGTRHRPWETMKKNENELNRDWRTCLQKLPKGWTFFSGTSPNLYFLHDPKVGCKLFRPEAN